MIPLVGLALALGVGCETTDYEPLIMKKKLKELEARLDQLGDGANTAQHEKLEARIRELEQEIKSLKTKNAFSRGGG